jgi:hypothetical protein
VLLFVLLIPLLYRIDTIHIERYMRALGGYLWDIGMDGILNKLMECQDTWMRCRNKLRGLPE